MVKGLQSLLSVHMLVMGEHAKAGDETIATYYNYEWYTEGGAVDIMGSH